MDLRAQLMAAAEPNYRDFSARLVPGCGTMLGVRLPALRAMARELARGDWRTYLIEARDDFFEEIMLQGLVLGCIKADAPTLLPYVAHFLPKITNWSVCDSFCTGFRLADREPEAVWAFLLPLFRSEQPYEIRVAVVMSLSHFLTPADLGAVLEQLESVHHEDYYVKMAVAWALATAFVKGRAQTLTALLDGQWDDWTFNKAITKCIESYRVSEEDKAMLRTLRRKSTSAPTERSAQCSAQAHGAQSIEHTGYNG